MQSKLTDVCKVKTHVTRKSGAVAGTQPAKVNATKARGGKCFSDASKTRQGDQAFGHSSYQEQQRSHTPQRVTHLLSTPPSPRPCRPFLLILLITITTTTPPSPPPTSVCVCALRRSPGRPGRCRRGGPGLHLPTVHHHTHRTRLAVAVDLVPPGNERVCVWGGGGEEGVKRVTSRSHHT